MHAIEFLRGSTSTSLKPLYSVYGDDAFLRHEAVAAIVRAAFGDESSDAPVARFGGDSAGLAEVLDELRTLPFLAKHRLVTVDDADKFVSAHRRELESYAEHPAETGVLVLCPKVWASNTKLAKLVAARGLAIECKTPREAELPGWLVQLALDRFGARLEPDAARLLVELVGPEVGLLCSEVEKLTTYVGERGTTHRRGTIQRGDVAAMVGAGRVETIWRVLDSATSGRAAEALHDLDRLLTSGEHPVGLLAAMCASLRKVHYAGQLRRSRRSLPEACREAGIPPFAVESTGRQHTHLGPGRVDRLPAMMLEADLALKGASALPPRVIIERFLIELARPRAD